MEFILDPSLVLYLPLYELDGASFMSKDAYGHMAVVNGALWTPEGRMFDGIDDKIDCGNNPALAPASLTVEIWLKATSFAHAYNAAVAHAVNLARSGYEILVKDNGKLAPYLGGVAGWICYDGTGTHVLETDTWHHIVLMFERPMLAGYVNGELDKSESFDDAIVTPTKTLLIGNDDFPGRMFTGKIGEVRIYNRALTYLEVRHNYLATKWRYR